MNPDSPNPPPPPAPPEGKRRLSERFREQARAEVLEASLRVFQRDGLKEARIDAIAAEAGVSVGTIYNLFGDRTGLVAAAMERGRAEVFDRVRAYLDATEDRPFEERLYTVVHTLVGTMRMHWQTLRMLSEGQHPAECASGPHRPPPNVVREVHALMTRLVRHGIDTGAIAASDPHVAACLLMGAIRTTIDVDLILGLDAPSEDRADTILQMFLHGTARR